MSKSIRHVKQLLSTSKSSEIVPTLKITSLSFTFDEIMPKVTANKAPDEIINHDPRNVEPSIGFL